MPQKIVPIPYKGLHVGGARAFPPEGTSRDLMNVRPHDPLEDMLRLSTRAGMAKQTTAKVNDGWPIQNINFLLLSREIPVPSPCPALDSPALSPIPTVPWSPSIFPSITPPVPSITGPGPSPTPPVPVSPSVSPSVEVASPSPSTSAVSVSGSWQNCAATYCVRLEDTVVNLTNGIVDGTWTATLFGYTWTIWLKNTTGPIAWECWIEGGTTGKYYSGAAGACPTATEWLKVSGGEEWVNLVDVIEGPCADADN